MSRVETLVEQDIAEPALPDLASLLHVNHFMDAPVTLQNGRLTIVTRIWPCLYGGGRRRTRQEDYENMRYTFTYRPANTVTLAERRSQLQQQNHDATKIAAAAAGVTEEGKSPSIPQRRRPFATKVALPSVIVCEPICSSVSVCVVPKSSYYKWKSKKGGKKSAARDNISPPSASSKRPVRAATKQQRKRGRANDDDDDDTNDDNINERSDDESSFSTSSKPQKPLPSTTTTVPKVAKKSRTTTAPAPTSTVASSRGSSATAVSKKAVSASITKTEIKASKSPVLASIVTNDAPKRSSTNGKTATPPSHSDNSSNGITRNGSQRAKQSSTNGTPPSSPKLSPAHEKSTTSTTPPKSSNSSIDTNTNITTVNNGAMMPMGNGMPFAMNQMMAAGMGGMGNMYGMMPFATPTGTMMVATPHGQFPLSNMLQFGGAHQFPGGSGAAAGMVPTQMHSPFVMAPMFQQQMMQQLQLQQQLLQQQQQQQQQQQAQQSALSTSSSHSVPSPPSSFVEATTTPHHDGATVSSNNSNTTAGGVDSS
jgi:hypothetical protein